MDFPTFAEVRARVGGVKGVIRLLGDAPPFDHKWKNFSKCPFCGNKDCAGVFEKGGTDWFKCQHTACSSGGRAVTETGYINLREGLSEESPAEGPSPAYKRVLELAGMYVEPKAEERKAESGERNDGTRGRAAALPNPVLPPDVPAPAPTPAPTLEPPDDVALIRQAIELIRQEKKASIRLLQAGLRLGYARALRIMAGLERWGVVGPAVAGDKFRAVLNLPSSAEATEGRPEAGAEPAQSVGSIEPGSGNPAAAIVPTGATYVPPSGPAFINDGGGSPGPSENGGAVPPELSPQQPPPVPPPAAAPGPVADKNVRAPAPKPEEKPVLAPGLMVVRWFYDGADSTTSEMRPFLPDGSRVPSPLPTALLKKIKYQPVSLDEERCLPPPACVALGLKANPRANESRLLEARDLFDWEELHASGLWVEADHRQGKPRRPQAQFHGFGQIGKKPKSEQQDEDDKLHWGWSFPTMIPYFNEAGELIKLRPHKGGAASGTAAGSEHIYVPRDYRSLRTATKAADRVEKFYVVIICEGEYKAAVIWWTLGAGAVLRGDGRPPVGVCALPGISFAKNPAYRSELDDWLRAVGCQRVIVAFDDEDKGDKPMRQAHDAEIYGRYLATELNHELKIPALWLALPAAWRVNGKADWDGAAVKWRNDARGVKMK